MVVTPRPEYCQQGRFCGGYTGNQPNSLRGGRGHAVSRENEHKQGITPPPLKLMLTLLRPQFLAPSYDYDITQEREASLYMKESVKPLMKWMGLCLKVT